MISPELQEVLRKERKRLLKDLMAINAMLGDTSQSEPEEQFTAAPPFPYRTEPLAPVKVVPKVKLTQEFDIFCKPRAGQVVTVRNFKAYLSANFPEGGYLESSAACIVHQAHREGKLDLVKLGTRGNKNPTTYRVKGGTAA